MFCNYVPWPVTGRSAPNGPPPELQLSLASLQAPKLGRGPGIADEPFAWDSREFLRKKCIGKQVRWKRLGSVHLQSPRQRHTHVHVNVVMLALAMHS